MDLYSMLRSRINLKKGFMAAILLAGMTLLYKNMLFILNRTSLEKAERKEFSAVVCLMVQNEGLNLREWLDFHLSIGFDRFVFYDNNSTDSTWQILSSYSTAVIDVVAWPPKQRSNCGSGTCLKCFDGVGRPERNGHDINCQISAYQDCVQRYQNRALWLALFDVDEFVFPCKKGSYNFSSLLENLAQSYSVMHLECLKFGTSGFQSRLLPGQSLLGTHTHRSPYKELGEPEEKIRKECNCSVGPRSGVNLCESAGGHKHMAIAEKIVAEKVDVHGIQVRRGWTPKDWREIYHGNYQDVICCNHYSQKSTEEIVAKAKKNLNIVYLEMLQTRSYVFYNQVEDKRILDHVPNGSLN